MRSEGAVTMHSAHRGHNRRRSALHQLDAVSAVRSKVRRCEYEQVRVKVRALLAARIESSIRAQLFFSMRHEWKSLTRQFLQHYLCVVPPARNLTAVQRKLRAQLARAELEFCAVSNAIHTFSRWPITRPCAAVRHHVAAIDSRVYFDAIAARIRSRESMCKPEDSQSPMCWSARSA